MKCRHGPKNLVGRPQQNSAGHYNAVVLYNVATEFQTTLILFF